MKLVRLGIMNWQADTSSLNLDIDKEDMMGNNSHKIVAAEVRKLGLEDYLKKYKSKIKKKQLYTIARDYIHENYMLNGHTHVVVTNEILKNYEDSKEER